MISRIEIRNYQALHHVELELGRFTVIVGPSDSGKSATMRALRMLTSNQRGNAFITTGERVATVAATTDHGTVTLKRGKTTKDDSYVILPTDHPEQQKTYTKLNGEVPEEVSAFIGIRPKDPINYAGQFDKPYLLDETGGTSATVLGGLTNVSVIFNAARESNTRKLNSAKMLRTRNEDLTEIRERIEFYRPLKTQLAAMEQAEGHIERARKLTSMLERLQSATSALEAAEQIIAKLTPLAAVEVPSLARIEKIRAMADRLDQLTEQLSSAQFRNKNSADQLTQALTDITSAQQRYIDQLTEAGTCPTCGQSTHDREAIHA